MEKEELKPCPFCGNNSRWCDHNPEKPEDDHNCHYIVCDNCKTQYTVDDPATYDCETVEEIKEIVCKAWNNRVPTEREAPCQNYCEQVAFNAEIKKLKQLLNECHKRFKSYEMDVDMNRPDHHIDFMKRVEVALGI